MEKIELNVEGMMCEGCENRIKNSVKMIEGVSNVEANHNTGKVNVIVDSLDKKAEIIAKIEDIGYEVKE